MRGHARFLLIALMVAASPASATASVPQGLSIASVGSPVGAASPGSLRAVVKVASKGGATRRSKLSLYLSRDRQRDGKDARLRGTTAVRALKRGRSITVQAEGKLGAAVTPGVYRVIACVKGGGCRTARKTTTVLRGFAKPNPVDIRTKADTARASTGLFTTEGGVLKATGADGGTYTLTIPADALLNQEQITMTPLSGAEGLPFKRGLGAGVKLEPDGLRFAKYVLLGIKPATPIPAAEQAGLGFAGSGSDLYLHPLSRDRDKIEFPIDHFSGYAVARSTTAEYDRQGNRVPTDREAWATQTLTGAFGRERDGQNPGRLANATKIALHVIRNEAVKPALEEARRNPERFHSAGQEYFSYLRMQVLLSGRDEDFDKELFDLFAQAFKRAAEHAMTQCLNGDLSKILDVVAFERNAIFLGLPSPTGDQDIGDLYARCLRFKVDYDFEGTYPESEVSLHARAVDVALTVVFDPVTTLRFAAEQPLEYVSYTERRYCVNALTPVKPFRITHVELDLSGRDEPRFLIAQIDPGEATETVQDCPEDGDGVYAPKHWYNGAFAASNYDAAIGQGIYRFGRFEFPDPPYARTETARAVAGCEINKGPCATPPYCDFNPGSGQLQEDCAGRTTLVFEHDPKR